MNTIRCLCATALLAALLPATAATPATTAQAAYQQETARCQRGESGQDRATCLKEAGAAYDEARRSQLGAGPAADLSRNASLRCDAQPAEDREACVQRLQGGAQGSVQGGGLLRETESPK
jgi:hypothetical protein